MSDARHILSILDWHLLFSGNKEQINKQYRSYAKQWHPDINNDPRAEDVFRHIEKLHNEALNFINFGVTKIENKTYLRTVDGKTIQINFKKLYNFEFGEMYINTETVVYVIKPIYRKFIDNFVYRFNNFKFASENMKEQMEKFLPKVIKIFEFTDTRFGIVLEKPKDVVLLRDVCNFFGGYLHPKQVAWILNSLYNIACYLQYSELTHNAISLDTNFVSMQHHSSVLIGGWWYSVPIGSKMLGCSTDLYEYLPEKSKKSKISTKQFDLDLIKIVGKKLLGDPRITGVPAKQMIPVKMLHWLKRPSSDDAIEEYKACKKMLYDCFGKPKFVVLNFDSEKLYD